MNERNMRNPPENDCESLWGTGLTEAKFVTATVRFYGDHSKLQRVKRPPESPIRPLRSSKSPRSPSPLTDIPKKSPLHTVRTPYPLIEVPKKPPPVAHIHSAIRS